MFVNVCHLEDSMKYQRSLFLSRSLLFIFCARQVCHGLLNSPRATGLQHLPRKKINETTSIAI